MPRRHTVLNLCILENYKVEDGESLREWYGWDGGRVDMVSGK